ncbi:MAG: LysE family transporter [Arthrobacter sp.]|jgi:threonine efflux protein|nr:LysE family transporter [Arthrobacter sp.]
MPDAGFVSALLPLMLTWVIGMMSPGPDLFLVIHRSLAGSRREGIAAAAGIASGVALWLVVAFTGLAAVMTAFPPITVILQVAGGLVLIWMGIGTLRSWLARRGQAAAEGEGNDDASGRLGVLASYRRGLLTNLANPKFVIYISAVFAPFIAAQRPVWQTIFLLVLLVVTTVGWFSVIAALVGHPKLRSAVSRWTNTLDAVAGVVFILLGLGFVVLAAVEHWPGA